MGDDVVVEQGAEAFGQLVVGASQRREMFAVDKDRTIGRLASPREQIRSYDCLLKYRQSLFGDMNSIRRVTQC